MNALPLSFPELTLDRLLACATDLDALEAWLAQQASLSSEQTITSVLQLLDELNQLRIQPLPRLQWMQRLITFLTDYSLPADQQQWLHERLALGYKRCINDLLQQREQLQPPAFAKALLLSLYQAIHHLGLLVLHTLYQQAAPGNVWQELFFLYHLACRSKLQHKVVMQVAPQTCQQAYYRVVLLALLVEEQALASHPETLWHFFGQTAHKIQEHPHDQLPQQGFVLAAARGYFPLSFPDPKLTLKPADVVFSTDKLQQAWLAQLAAKQLPCSDQALVHLLALLNPQHAQVRQESYGDVHLVVGMSAVHYYLNQQQPLESLTGDKGPVLEKRKNPFMYEAEDDPWDSAPDAVEQNRAFSTTNGAINFEATGWEKPAPSMVERKSPWPVYTLQKISIFAKGYQLFLAGELPEQLYQGALVAVEENKDNGWRVGHVVQITPLGKGAQLEIHLLARQLLPCAIRPAATGFENQAPYRTGFLLPENKILHLGEGLLTPPLPFRTNMVIDLTDGQKNRVLQLVEKLNSPGEFNFFRIQPYIHC